MAHAGDVDREIAASAAGLLAMTPTRCPCEEQRRACPEEERSDDVGEAASL